MGILRPDGCSKHPGACKCGPHAGPFPDGSGARRPFRAWQGVGARCGSKAGCDAQSAQSRARRFGLPRRLRRRSRSSRAARRVALPNFSKPRSSLPRSRLEVLFFQRSAVPKIQNLRTETATAKIRKLTRDKLKPPSPVAVEGLEGPVKADPHPRKTLKPMRPTRLCRSLRASASLAYELAARHHCLQSPAITPRSAELSSVQSKVTRIVIHKRDSLPQQRCIILENPARKLFFRQLERPYAIVHMRDRNMPQPHLVKRQGNAGAFQASPGHILQQPLISRDNRFRSCHCTKTPFGRNSPAASRRMISCP